MNYKFFIVLTFTIIFNVVFLCDFAESVDKNTASNYTIVSSEDLSKKATSKSLSSYSPSELMALPMNVRKEYRIIVPSKITKEGLKASMKHLVAQKTKKNPEIDAIIIFAYDRKEDAEGAYTYGKMVWAPNGRLGDVTPAIASSNDRSSYRYKFDIANKVGNLSTDSVPTKREYKIYDTFEKALWADPNVDETIVEKRVAKKLGISVKELKRIWLKVMIHKMK